MISVIQASLLFKVTNRTIQTWIKEDNLQEVNGQYSLNDLRASYNKRHSRIPHLLSKAYK